jgi:prepilin-type N-terminal cleavage/methylation domain-containing protein
MPVPSTRTAEPRVTRRDGERGFTLLELVASVGVLAIAGAATAGAFTALARHAAPGDARDAALTAGENALARARAAVAYAPASAAAADRSWALVPGETDYVAGARLRGAAPCGATAAATLKLPVAASFDASAQRFTVVVTYPRDPCGVAADGTIPAGNAETVTLEETLPPSAYAPGTTLTQDVAPPARM